MIEAVRQGQTKRAPIERFVDVITSHFVPVITTLAIVTWVIWLCLGLSGVLPASTLDGNVGGWGKSLSSQFRPRDINMTSTPSLLVLRVRHLRLRYRLSVWNRSRRPNSAPCWFGSRSKIWNSRARRWRSIPRGVANRCHCLRQDRDVD